jgi:hypothetical protein
MHQRIGYRLMHQRIGYRLMHQRIGYRLMHQPIPQTQKKPPPVSRRRLRGSRCLGSRGYHVELFVQLVPHRDSFADVFNLDAVGNAAE